MRHKNTAFHDAHALVTGAASGIGRATALELARRGARVSVTDVNASGAEETAAHVRASGGVARAFPADIARSDDVDRLAENAVAENGPVDLLVNNAGVAIVAPFARTSAADLEWIMGVNVWGPLRLTRALLSGMITRDRGHVVFVASLAGLVGAPGMVAYSTTKFAIVGFAEALRLELGETSVGITTVCPGYVKTNLQRASRYDNDGFRRFLDHAPTWYGMKTESVARALVDGVGARSPLVVLGPEKLGWWVKRASPRAAFAIARWIGKRSGTIRVGNEA